jgi:DNA repair exonuclease SbcCD ATPase subunit
LQYKEIQGEQSDLVLEDNLYTSNKKLQEEHLFKIEKYSESRIKVLTEEKENYESKVREKVDKTIELTYSLMEEDVIKDNATKVSTLKTQVNSKLGEIRKQHSFFIDNDDCPVCEQPIKKSFKKTRNSELEKQAQEYENAITEMENELIRLKKDIDVMAIKANMIQNNNSEIKALTSMIEKCRKDLELLNNDKKQIDELKDGIKKLTLNIEEIYIRMRELKEDIFYLDICKNLLHDTGIKSKIIKQYLPVMNQTIQKYLGVLDFYVNFTLNEQFEETIKSRYRDDFSYASFSEGEKMRIDLALMFTWREIAKLKNSTNTNLLIMDEVFDSSLDAAGTEDFLKILNSLESQSIFVISHKGDILFDKFNSIIKFVKQNNFSKLIES